MEWEKEGEIIFKELLSCIPEMVRGLAEDTMRDKAQDHAEEDGSKTVRRIDAIAGFIIATPFPMRKYLKSALEKSGVTVAEYGKWVK